MPLKERGGGERLVYTSLCLHTCSPLDPHSGSHNKSGGSFTFGGRKTWHLSLHEHTNRSPRIMFDSSFRGFVLRLYPLLIRFKQLFSKCRLFASVLPQSQGFVYFNHDMSSSVRLIIWIRIPYPFMGPPYT